MWSHLRKEVAEQEKGQNRFKGMKVEENLLLMTESQRRGWGGGQDRGLSSEGEEGGKLV